MPANRPTPSGKPAPDDKCRTLMEGIRPRLAALAPERADVSRIAEIIVELVDLPAGQHPVHVHHDPNRKGSEVVSVVKVRVDFHRRIGLDDLLARGAARSTDGPAGSRGSGLHVGRDRDGRT
jgi:hypothetical protein